MFGQVTMSGQWKGSDRKARLPKDWPRRVAATRRRAGGRCQHHGSQCLDQGNGRCLCPSRCTQRGTDCDHIMAGDDHSVANLQWLCGEHHALKSSREGLASRGAVLFPMHRRPGKHPGLL